MEKSDSIAELVVALSRAQGEFPPVPLNSVNPFLHNKYADLGAVIETAKEILSNHGIAVTQLVGGSDGRISVTTVLAHVSGQWISEVVSLQIEVEKGKSTAQVAGSIVTYLRRYALAGILGLYAGDDDDGSAGGKDKDRGQSEKPPQKPATQKPPAPVAKSEDDGLIVIWDGKSRRDPKAIISEAAADWIDKKFVGKDVIKAKAHLESHLKEHFGVAKLRDMSYEKATAFVQHCEKKGDDPHWYKPKEDAVVTDDPAVDLNALSNKWLGMNHEMLAKQDKENITEMLALVKAGAIAPEDYDAMIEVLRA